MIKFNKVRIKKVYYFCTLTVFMDFTHIYIYIYIYVLFIERQKKISAQKVWSKDLVHEKLFGHLIAHHIKLFNLRN